MAPLYKIALIQYQPKPVSPEENFATAESYIRTAASQGTHVAILPEYHLTSWCPEHPDFLAACAASAAYLSRYQALARDLSISIVPGTICEVHGALPAPGTPAGADGQTKEFELRNIAYFVAAETGDVAGTYQKKNLWHPERPHLAAGTEIPHTAFDTPLTHADGRAVRAGMLVCWDLAFPEAFRALVADGADMILIPSFWYVTDVDPVALAYNANSERVFLDSVTVARACESAVAVVFCNAGGCSQVAMPIVGSLGRIAGEGEEMKVVEVDMEVLRVAEGNYKVREDMRRSGWHYAPTLGVGP